MSLFSITEIFVISTGHPRRSFDQEGNAFRTKNISKTRNNKMSPITQF
jgi:hypothetical protein